MWQDPLACTTLLALGGGQESLKVRTQAAQVCPFARRRVVRQLKYQRACLCIRFGTAPYSEVIHSSATSKAQQTATTPSLREYSQREFCRIRIFCIPYTIFHKSTMVGRLSMKIKKTVQSRPSCLTEENLLLHSSAYLNVRGMHQLRHNHR